MAQNWDALSCALYMGAHYTGVNTACDFIWLLRFLNLGLTTVTLSFNQVFVHVEAATFV